MAEIVGYLINTLFVVGLSIFFAALLTGFATAAVFAVQRKRMSDKHVACMFNLGRAGGLVMLAVIAAGVIRSALQGTLFQ
ncbi:MAG: hypothetical protein AAF078_12210 [Planctomycetota bacterium]